MFKNNDKRLLYCLVDQYLHRQIEADIFCEEYHICFGLELDLDTLTELEAEVFSLLYKVVARFTSIEADLKTYPGTYFSEDQLRDASLSAKGRLGAIKV